MLFPMRLDRLHRTSTAVLMVLVPGILAVVLTVAPTPPRGIAVAVLTLVAGTLVLAWAMAPRALQLKGGELRVLRRAWAPLRIPLDDVSHVEEGPALKGALRLAGTGGFFGSYGLFYAPGVGRFRLYATRTTGVVTITRNGALPVLVTPEDAPAFVQAANAYRNPDAYL